MKHWKALKLAVIAMLFTAGMTLGAAQGAGSSPKPAATAIAPVSRTSADEDIRDIRPPIHIPYSWLWAAYVAGGLALAGAGVAAWRLLHGRSRQKALYELTLEQLEGARSLMQPQQGYEFSIAVSEIIRGYIEKRFSTRVTHQTTQEFLRELLTRANQTLTQHQPLLADFLEHCDLAKFARWHLSIARDFVIQTGKPSAPVVPERGLSETQTVLTEPRLT
jgi:hypothetical protein